MQRFLRGLARPSTFVPFLALPIAFFFAFNYAAQENVQVMINGAMISVSAVIIMTWTPSWITALRRPEPKPKELKEQYLITGMLMLWLGAMGAGVWRIWYLVMGKPLWMMGNWFPYFTFTMIVMAGFYFAAVPSRGKGKWTWLMVAVFGAIMIAVGALAWLTPEWPRWGASGVQ